MSNYKQGDLDGLCGVYSVVNAVSALMKFNYKKSKKTFSDIILNLEESKKLSKAILEGIDINELGTILSWVSNKYKLSREKPFHRNPNVSLDVYWDAMQKCIDNNGVIILGLAGKHDHWTFAESISEKRINLIDSDNLKHIYKSKCSTKDFVHGKIHKLSPYHTYFLFKK